MRALRSMLRAPSFFVAATLALGLGIGASAALFSVIDAVLLRPLPYSDQDRLLIVDLEQNGRPGVPSYPQFLDWRAEARSFAGMAFTFGDAFLLRTDAGTHAVGLAMTSEGFFGLMGARPAIGRLPSADEENGVGPRVVVISHTFWRGHFGGDPEVLGQAFDTDKGDFTVIGVMPAGFAFPSWASAWTPLAPLAGQFPALTQRDWRADARAIARLLPNLTVEQARAELTIVARNLEVEYPVSDAETTPRLTPVAMEVIGDVQRPLLLFTGAVAVLLLIACTNVATLSVARGSARARELSVRSALGASRWQITRLLLIESALVAIAGAACGLLLAFWSLDLLRLAVPAGLPRLEEIALDGRAVGFTVAVAALTLVLSGLAPALRASRGALGQSAGFGLRESHGQTEVRLRSGLLVAQVALSLVLLVDAGLLIRSFALLRAVNPGFEPDGLLEARIQPPITTYRTSEALQAVYDRVYDEIARMPGVERAALVNHQGLAGVRTDIRVAGQVAQPAAEPRALYRVVGADYFETIGQPVIRGRGVTSGDMTPTSRALVLNQRLAAALWPSADPIGKQVTIWKQVPDRPDYGQALDLEVVGVVADAIFQSPGGPGVNVVYIPFTLNPTVQASLMIRGSAAPTSLIAPIRSAIQSVDPDIPTHRIRTVTQSTWQSLIQRVDLVLLSAFAAAALVLAEIGLYGLVACILEQRRREIGVRRALGASDWRLLLNLVGHGVGLATLGLAIGAPIAAVSGHALRASLFGVGPLDALTLAGSALVPVAFAAAASYLPARRLNQLSPLDELRED